MDTSVTSENDIKILKKENEKLQYKTDLFEEQSGINLKDLQSALELIEKSKRNNDENGLDFLQSTEIDKWYQLFSLFIMYKINNMYII